jgi:hypothetical protein
MCSAARLRGLICTCACVLVAIVSATPASAQFADDGQEAAERKQAIAVRLAAGAIRLDGRLAEEVWRSAVPVTDFVQRQPDEGAPPSDPLEVRFAYDDDAIYVGARLWSSRPIQAPLGRRDEVDQAEHFLVSFDTYLDRRTAYTFGITAAGVRVDRYYGSDDRDNRDAGYNPVWEGRAAVDERGWSAELRIPFSQLRFNDRRPQVWGMNLQRWVPSLNEEVYWALVPRTDERWASLFGDLTGIDGIAPRRRLEVLPYVSGSSRVPSDRDPRDPFTTAANLRSGAGFDAKVGIGSNLTLEATVNPDFGQVEADPAEVNLSAFETFFGERRPFFLEGGDLLRSSVNNYFYSRRIGAAPAVRAQGDFVDSPQTTTILGAAKLTGRLASGTSIGALGALTGEESARTFMLPQQQMSSLRVAPRTAYGVARIQQEFGPPGSTIGLLTTAMHRDLPPGDPLADMLTRNAFSLSGDSILRLNDGEYDLRTFLGASYVGGNAAAIDRVQRSSAHYFQRPDAAYLNYDATRTSMSGIKTGAELQRRTGRHWLWAANTEYESPDFETNDMGRLTTADGPVLGGELQYRETVPGSWYRDYSFSVRHERRWNYDGDRREGLVSSSAFLRWPNFWETEAEFTYTLRALDDRLTRGGPLMQTPAGWRVDVEAENSDAARTRAEFSAWYGRDEDSGLEFGLDTGLSIQPGSQWQLVASPRYDRLVETQQFVTTREGGPAATFGRRYIFGRLDRSTYATEFRLNYTFKPDLTLDLYAEPFAASGRYSGLGELDAARSRALRAYGTDGTTAVRLDDGSTLVRDAADEFLLPGRDFNVVSFRSNLVLRWEWRAGSTLYLVWQQDRSAEELTGARATIGDMFGSLGSRGDNFFAIKASFWFSPD